LRNGSEEYDFENAEVIKEGSQAIVIKIKCIDGKTYAGKKFKNQIG
jgi:hypothetical protein